jgi:hypothetical protein
VVNNGQNLDNVVCERPLKECKDIIVQTKQEQILKQNNEICFIFYRCIKKQSETQFSYREFYPDIAHSNFVSKVFLVIKKNFRGRRPTICEIFEITKTFFSVVRTIFETEFFFTCYYSFFRPYRIEMINWDVETFRNKLKHFFYDESRFFS